jgi:hypothetical protein
MRSYEPPKIYIIYNSHIGCRKEDITGLYFDRITGKFKEDGATGLTTGTPKPKSAG